MTKVKEDTVDQPKVDETPQKVNADLRKFNRTEAVVNKALAETQPLGEIASSEGLVVTMDALSKLATVEKMIEEKRKALSKPFYDAQQKINQYAKTLTAKIPPEVARVKALVIAWDDKEKKRIQEERRVVRVAWLESVGFTRREEGSLPAGYWLERIGYVVTESDIARLDDTDWSDEVAMITNKIEEDRKSQLATLQSEKESGGFFGDEDSEIDTKLQELAKETLPAVKSFVPSFGGSSGGVKGITKRWTFEISDAGQIPREYLVPDEALIRAAVNQGVRDIAGVRIFQETGLAVRKGG
jgi:hypothetical protein